MNQAALIALLLLSACGHDVALVPKPVDVPVGIPCKAPVIPKPVWATTKVVDSDTMFVKARALAATNEQRKAYEVKLISNVASCQ